MMTMEHRIVSLLPSATEIVCLAGAEHLLVGRSHECDYPKSITHLPILTSATNGHFTNSRDIHNKTCEALEAGRGLYSIDSDLLISLKPTIIVTQDLCEVCSIDLVTVERIVHRSKIEPKPQIISLNPFSLQEVIDDIIRVGKAVGVEDKAQAQVDQIQSKLQSIKDQVAKLGEAKLKKCCFLEWTDPLFCGGHWTPAMIELVGGSHSLNPPIPGKEHSGPSFVVTPEQVADLDPDVIVICPCGLDLQMGRTEATQMAQASWWKELRAVEAGNVFLVDGNAHFNRPGPRLMEALQFLVAIMHERWELIPAGFEWELFRVLPGDKEASPDLATQEAAATDAPAVLAPPSDAPPKDSHDSPDRSTVSEDATVATSSVGDQEDTVPTPQRPSSDLIIRNGFHSAPNLPLDVEECYKAAIQANRNNYKDPISGYSAFTEVALRTRATCCGNRCRHCPYGHFRVDSKRKGVRFNRITAPAYCAASGHDPVYGSTVRLLAVAAGQETLAAGAVVDLQAAAESQGLIEDIVVLVVMDPLSRQMWVPGDQISDHAQHASCADGACTGDVVALDHVMDWCMKNKLSVAAMPVGYPVGSTPAEFAKASLHSIAQEVVTAAKEVIKDRKISGLSWVGGEKLPAMPWLGEGHVTTALKTNTQDASWHDIKV